MAFDKKVFCDAMECISFDFLTSCLNSIKSRFIFFLSFLMHYYFYCNHFYCESGCFSLNTFNFLDDLCILGIPNWSCKFNNRSNIGLATLNIESLLHVLRFLFKNCLLRMAQQLINFTCGSHDSLLLMITPRYFSYLTFFNFDFSILYSQGG